MRLLSALMAACTVLAIYLFLREIIPRTPWTWTVGALMVAFEPMFAFIGAGVQGDNLLYLASALTFLATARAWRRGLTTRRGVAIGTALAIGMLASSPSSRLSRGRSSPSRCSPGAPGPGAAHPRCERSRRRSPSRPPRCCSTSCST